MADVNIPVASISLSAEEIRIPRDMTEQLQFSILPTDATNKNVTWNTSAIDIATVDETCKVKGIREGTATITVTTEDGNFSATCTVYITQPVTHITNEDNIYEHTPSSKQVFYDGNYVTCYPRF